jgi:hypothetical protein
MSISPAVLLALSLAQAPPPATAVSAPRPTASPAAPTAGPADPSGQPGKRSQPPAPGAAAKGWDSEPALPEWGLSVDASIPAGIALDAVYRPVPFVRLWAGPAWNYAAFGFQAGAGLVLVRWAVTPVLTVEAGRYFAADISRFLDRAGGIPSEMLPLLEDVRYSYAAAHLGLEFGSQRGFSFAFRLGLARVSIKTSGTGEVVRDEGTPDETRLVFVNPRFAGTAPSLKLGFTYWF